MNPTPNSPSHSIMSIDPFDMDLLNELIDFDFTNSIPIALGTGHPPLSSNSQLMHVSVSSPSFPSQSSEINSVTSAGDLGSTSVDPFAMVDKVLAPNAGNHSLSINDQPMQSFGSKSCPVNPDELSSQMNLLNQSLDMNSHEIAPPTFYQNLQMSPERQLPLDEPFPQANFLAQNYLEYPNQQILPSNSLSQNLQMTSMAQLAPSQLAINGLDFPMNAFEQPLPPQPCFTSQVSSVYHPTNFYAFESQLPRVDYAPPSVPTVVRSENSFVNSMGDIMNHDPIGVACFLAGVVRPSPDVVQIYKCGTCFVEFPCAQAFGGHMKSHKRKMENEGEGGSTKKSKRDRRRASSASSSSKGKKRNLMKKKNSESEEDEEI